MKNPCSRVPENPLLALLTCLIADSAGSLAGRLAGSLAFAAAAFFHGFLKFFCFHSLNMFHDLKPPDWILTDASKYNTGTCNNQR